MICLVVIVFMGGVKLYHIRVGEGFNEEKMMCATTEV